MDTESNGGDMDRDETMAALEAAGTAQNRKVYARHGIGEPLFGVSYKDLGALQKRTKVDEILSEELWATRNHDARILATRIADPGLIELAVVESWAADLADYVLTDAFAGLVVRTPHAGIVATAWIEADDEWVERAGWLVLAGLALRDRDHDDEFYAAYLPRIENELHGAENRVRDAMNSTLISIGTRSDTLEEEALAAAARIGTVDVDHGKTGCKTAVATSYIPKARERQRKKDAKLAARSGAG
jgi:3-methyladenine DNA glycosylase AlkD